MRTSDYIVYSCYDSADKRHCHNMGKFFEEIEELRPFDKVIKKVAKVSDGSVLRYSNNGILFEFNKGCHWYVLDISNNVSTLQENLENGDIVYIVDMQSITKCLNRLKKLMV